MNRFLRQLAVWTSLAVGGAGCIDSYECTEGEGEVVIRLLYVVDDSGTEADLHSVDAHGEVMYAVGDAGAISTGDPDTGEWTLRDSGVESDLVGVASLGATVAVAVGGDGTVLRSEDAGASWAIVDAGLEPGTRLSAVTAVSDQGFVIVGDGVGRWSADAGATWSESEGLDGAVLNDVAVMKQERLYAVGDAGAVAESQDAGATWTLDLVDDAFAQLDLRGVSFRGSGEGRIVTNSGRVLATDNWGLSWTSDGLVAASGHAVALVSTETWVAAEGNAVFYRYESDPAYVERKLSIGVERLFDVRVSPHGEAVFVGQGGVILRGLLEYTQIPQACYGS